MRRGLLPLLLLLAPLLAPFAVAAPDPTPGGVRQWVEAELDLAQPTLTRIGLTGSLLIHKHEVGNRVYTASEMASSYQGASDLGAGVGDAFVSRMEGDVRAAVESTLATMFPTATRTVGAVTVDRASLNAARVDAYDPGIAVTFTASVVRTAEQIGLGSYSTDAIAAAFAAGAKITNGVDLSAKPGYRTTFTLHAPASPAGLAFASFEGSARVSSDKRALTVELDNQRGSTDLPRKLTVVLHDATASAPTAEDAPTTVDITMGALQAGATSVPLTASARTELRAVDVAERFPGQLPSKVDLPFVNADGLRGLHAAGAISNAALDDAEAALVDAARADLQKALGASATVTGALSRSDLALPATRPYDDAPPVAFTATGVGAYAIGDKAKDADVALDAGAALRLSVRLSSPKQPTTYVFHPPAGLVVSSAEGGAVAADGSSATVQVAPGAPAPTLSLLVRKAGVPSFTAEDAAVGIVVDLVDLDVSIGQAASGDFGSLVVEVRVDGDMSAIRVPDNVRESFGDNVELDYISSDGVRLVKARGLITDQQVADLEKSLLDTVTSGLASALGQRVDVTGGFEDASLAPGATGDILFRATASFTKPLSGADPGAQAAAIYTVPQSFTFPRVRDLDTTYTVILPRGLAVTGLDVKDGEATLGQAPDGREQFTVQPTGAQAVASMGIAITPTFLMIKFWPIVLLAVLILVLVIGTPIALFVMRRRKKAEK